MTAHIWDAPTHTCEQDGCTEPAVIDCGLPEWEGNVYWFCAEHAASNGFCYLCGSFEGGHESFEFSDVPGVCDECRRALEDELDSDDGEYEPDEFEDEPY